MGYINDHYQMPFSEHSNEINPEDIIETWCAMTNLSVKLRKIETIVFMRCYKWNK